MMTDNKYTITTLDIEDQEFMVSEVWHHNLVWTLNRINENEDLILISIIKKD